jgi:glycosyltransferase involved in cell wall biosynthesis
MTPTESRLPSRVLVFQPALPRYRRPFFQRFGERVAALTLVHGAEALPGENASPLGSLSGVRTIGVSHRALGPALWMPALWSRVGDATHDVVIFSWNSRYVHLPMALVRARRAGMGVVHWGHGYSTRIETPLRRSYRNLLARSADAIITYNQRAARDLVAGGLHRDVVFVAPNALDGAEIQEASDSWTRSAEDLARFRGGLGLDRCPLAIHVSRLSSEANLRVLIETWSLVADAVPEARLLIIGDGPARDQLLLDIEAFGVSGSVRCLGAIYGEDAIAPYFLCARLMLHPVKIGLSLNHAMTYGVPVATFDDATRHSPEFEALRDGVNGVAVPPGDMRELAGRVARVLRDEGLAADLGRRARETMRATYTIDSMVDGFVAATQRAHSAAARHARRPDRRTPAAALQER